MFKLTPMNPNVNLEKIRQALAQDNIALKKRALAILFNESVVEAKDLLEEYLGRENAPELQNMALQVLKKIKGFESQSKAASTDQITLLFQNPSPSSRILALRALLNRRAPEIPKLIRDHCSDETSPEAVSLIAEILKLNPSPDNLPQLIGIMGNPEEKIRMDAIEGMVNVMNGCLYPHILKSLLDPSPQIKMRAYQLISKISRANLLESLDFMLGSGNPEMWRLAGQLFPSFLGPDLVPILKKYLSIQDPEASSLIKRAFVLMAQKGNAEAAGILEGISKAGSMEKKGPTAGEAQILPAGLRKVVFQFPDWLVGPFHSLPGNAENMHMVDAIRDVYSRIKDVLCLSFICAYFNLGKRSAPVDKTCFRVLQNGLEKSDAVQILRTISPALPPPKSDKDLFPILISHRLLNDFSDTLLEQILSFQEIFQLIDENPNDIGKFIKALFQGIESLLQSINSILSNRIVVKFTDGIVLRVFNFSNPKPIPVDQKSILNFDLPTNHPFAISGDSTKALDLSPFLYLEASQKSLGRRNPGEHELWEFLNKFQIIDFYMAFLKQKEG